MHPGWKTAALSLSLLGLLLVGTACGADKTTSTGPSKATPTERPPTATAIPTATPVPAASGTNAVPTVSTGRRPMGGLQGPFSLNLDTGATGTSPDSGDFFLIVGTAPGSTRPVYCAIVSVGQAQLFNLGVVDFASVTRSQLQQSASNQNVLHCFSTANDTPIELVAGDVFGVLTNGNHYAKVQVASNDFAAGLAVTFQWVTYPNP